jgi:hypothetical protein
MTHEEALQHALGYAAGREDASGVRTKTAPRTVRGAPAGGWLDFGDAFAQGWDDYRAERRHNMINVKDAYNAWQASDGVTIFPWAPFITGATPREGTTC